MEFHLTPEVRKITTKTISTIKMGYEVVCVGTSATAGKLVLFFFCFRCHPVSNFTF